MTEKKLMILIFSQSSIKKTEIKISQKYILSLYRQSWVAKLVLKIL